MCLIQNFIENLRRQCEQEQISQRELSRRSGVHYVTVCKLLGGKHPNPSVALCESLAMGAGMEAQDSFSDPDLVITYS